MNEPVTTDEFIERKLASGKYKTRDELMQDALRIMQARDLAIAEVAEELRGPIERMKRGEPAKDVDPKEFIDKATARYHTQRNNGS